MSDVHCSQASLDADEPLAGTAAEGVQLWIALEYVRPWEPKPLGPSELPESVKTHLKNTLDHVAGARLQFIRKPGKPPRRPTLLVGCPSRQTLLRFSLDDYEALCAIDFAEIASSGAHPSGEAVAHPVHLVCVHGKRDRCCAEHGGAVFRAICERGDAEVWQTSHLGGHRFAACVLSFPDGVCYGRVRADHADALVEAHGRGELFSLEHFRGRCALDRPAQAAESFLRARQKDARLSAYAWRTTEPLDDGRWEVTFDGDDGTMNVTVRMETLPLQRPASCGGEPEPVSRFVECG